MEYKDEQDILVDLHIHTQASDGTWDAQQLMEQILENKIGIFSVTDYESVASLSQVAKMAVDNGLTFIPGVEMSTAHPPYVYHVLGYGIDSQHSELQELLMMNAQTFERINLAEIEYLSMQHESIQMEEYLSYKHDATLGGFKSYTYSLKKGICNNVYEYLKLIDGNAPWYLKERMKLVSLADAVEAIHGAGGFAVLAHPGVNFYNPDPDAIFAMCLESGFDGIECFHPENNPWITQKCIAFCQEKGLMITVGSDCHGALIDRRKLAQPHKTLGQIHIDKLLNRKVQKLK